MKDKKSVQQMTKLRLHTKAPQVFPNKKKEVDKKVCRDKTLKEF